MDIVRLLRNPRNFHCKFPFFEKKKKTTLNIRRERRVLLRRGQTGFGFNIVGGDGEEGIYLAKKIL